jgi:hypothetical protein
MIFEKDISEDLLRKFMKCLLACIYRQLRQNEQAIKIQRDKFYSSLVKVIL